MTDPFTVLGLDGSASAADVRRARRQLSKQAHPDAGGAAADMQALNAAAASALKAIAASSSVPNSASGSGSGPAESDPAGNRSHTSRWERDWSAQRSDTPSFTVEALPVETFEALLLASAALGEVEDDDPPYGLSVLLGEPFVCWCRLDVVPDAGSSTVSVSIARADNEPLPPIDAVRNAWIDRLNELDWSEL